MQEASAHSMQVSAASEQWRGHLSTLLAELLTCVQSKMLTMLPLPCCLGRCSLHAGSGTVLTSRSTKAAAAPHAAQAIFAAFLCYLSCLMLSSRSSGLVMTRYSVHWRPDAQPSCRCLAQQHNVRQMLCAPFISVLQAFESLPCTVLWLHSCTCCCPCAHITASQACDVCSLQLQAGSCTRGCSVSYFIARVVLRC